MNTNKVKTTLEMDGVITPQDIANRHVIMAQCLACYEYSRWDKTPFIEHDTQKEDERPFKCSFCGHPKHVLNSGVSLRSYNPTIHNKKKKPKTK